MPTGNCHWHTSRFRINKEIRIDPFLLPILFLMATTSTVFNKEDQWAQAENIHYTFNAFPTSVQLISSLLITTTSRAINGYTLHYTYNYLTE